MSEFEDSRENPWQILGQRDVYDNPWFRVVEHDVIHPGGNPGEYGVVSFKNLAVGIIPLDAEGYTWIVGQYRFALNEYSWEIPMGGVPLDTDPLAGAQRELREETGLSASRWKKILSARISNSVTDESGVVYVAEGLEQGEPDFDDTEKIEIRRLPFDDLVRMTMNGEITDCLSVAGIMQLAALRA
ncbi:MAG: NUDIX domain-containing protein [Gammaproteobacteria bacterium]